MSEIRAKKGDSPKDGKSPRACNFGYNKQKKLQTMFLTKEQLLEQVCKHAQKKNKFKPKKGIYDQMETMIESI